MLSWVCFVSTHRLTRPQVANVSESRQIICTVYVTHGCWVEGRQLKEPPEQTGSLKPSPNLVMFAHYHNFEINCQQYSVGACCLFYLFRSTEHWWKICILQ